MEILNNTQPSIPPLPPTQPIPTHYSQFHRLVTFLFKTKWSSLLWVILSSLIINIIIGVIFTIFSSTGTNQYEYMTVWSLFSSVFYLPLFWVFVIIFLRVKGYKVESSNILKAFGTIVLIFLALGIIGFGLCVLVLSAWN